MNKKILLSIFCSVMLLVLAGCEQGKLPPGPESPDEESAVPLGMATEALGGAPPCYAPGKVVPAGSFPGVFTVDKETVTLGADGKASVTLTFSEDYIWADLLQKREEGGKQVWTQYKWGSDLHADNTNAGECSKPYKCSPTEPNCVSRKGTYTCWLSGKRYTSPTIPLSKQAPQSNIVKCKDPVSNEVVDAAVFLAYTPKGNKKWLVQVVKVKVALPEAPGGFEEEEAAPTGCTKENACKGKNPGDTITCPAGSPSGATCKCKPDCEVEVTGGQQLSQTKLGTACTVNDEMICEATQTGSQTGSQGLTCVNNKYANPVICPAGQGCVRVAAKIAQCKQLSSEACSKSECAPDGKLKGCAVIQNQRFAASLIRAPPAEVGKINKCQDGLFVSS